MNNTKEDLISALEGLELRTGRAIKLSEALSKPENREDLKDIIPQILDLTAKLKKYG